MTSTAKRRKRRDRRLDARDAAKEAVVDLVSDCSEMEEDKLACSSAAGIGAVECSVRPKRKSRGCRSEGARSKSRDIP